MDESARRRVACSDRNACLTHPGTAALGRSLAAAETSNADGARDARSSSAGPAWRCMPSCMIRPSALRAASACRYSASGSSFSYLAFSADASLAISVAFALLLRLRDSGRSASMHS